MSDPDAYSSTLSELDAVANAAMTASQREMRAKPVLDRDGTSLEDVRQALTQVDLAWNAGKAKAFGVSTEAWQQALDVAGLASCGSLSELLAIIHRAESAAGLIRSGYTAVRAPGGAISWRR